jgi:hypothetical protein
VVAVTLLLIPLLLLLNYGIGPVVKAYLATGEDIHAAEDDIKR